MQMLNGLAAVLAAVVDDSVAVVQAELGSHLGNRAEDMRDNITIVLGDFIGTADMLLGNEQHMHGSLRVQIVKRDDFVVLIHLFGRNASCRDAAKYTVIH